MDFHAVDKLLCRYSCLLWWYCVLVGFTAFFPYPRKEPNLPKLVASSMLNSFYSSNITDVVSKFPSYLRETGFRNPTDFNNGPWQYAYGSARNNLWEWLSANPDHAKKFHQWMSVQLKGRGEHWFEYYPVKEKLSGVSPTSALIVDVGGSRGHDLRDFRLKYPHLQGRLILEDLDEVIQAAKATEDLQGIEAIVHNFFEPQPVKGARVYYLHKVLHDWPDKQAVQILSNVRVAMAPDSILLLHDSVMPETNVPHFGAWMDFHMGTAFAASERTQAQWIEVLGNAGFNEITTWSPQRISSVADILFEARVKGL
jgi:hypothetical protein